MWVWLLSDPSTKIWRIFWLLSMEGVCVRVCVVVVQRVKLILLSTLGASWLIQYSLSHPIVEWRRPPTTPLLQVTFFLSFFRSFSLFLSLSYTHQHTIVTIEWWCVANTTYWQGDMSTYVHICTLSHQRQYHLSSTSMVFWTHSHSLLSFLRFFYEN